MSARTFGTIVEDYREKAAFEPEHLPLITDEHNV